MASGASTDLRDYQIDAIERIRDALRAGKRRVLVVAPTGSGKTIVAAEIVRLAVARGSRVLFLAHRRELIDQTSAKLRDAGVAHGIILAGRPRSPQQHVQVASIQTVIRRDLPPADLVIVDEAHHVVKDNSYGKLLDQYPAAIILGLTATPWRLDKIGLADSFDSDLLVRRPHELLADGWLVALTGHRYRPIDTSRVHTTGGDFNAAELSSAARKSGLLGDVVREWHTHASGRLTAAFCVDIAHATDLAERFVAAGVSAAVVSYLTPAAERAALLARWRQREIRVLCNVELITEGFDLPELDCGLLCRPTLSKTLYLQMVGRLLRPAPGKTDARIHDHAGLLAAHGHPYASQRDYSIRVTAKQITGSEYREASDLPEADIADPAPTLELPGIAENIDSPDLAGAGDVRLIRQREFTRRWETRDLTWKRDFFARMVERHSLRKAVGIYRWLSGETEWPAIRWRLDAGEVLTPKLRWLLAREEQEGKTGT